MPQHGVRLGYSCRLGLELELKLEFELGRTSALELTFEFTLARTVVLNLALALARTVLWPSSLYLPLGSCADPLEPPRRSGLPDSALDVTPTLSLHSRSYFDSRSYLSPEPRASHAERPRRSGYITPTPDAALPRHACPRLYSRAGSLVRSAGSTPLL